MEARLRGVNGIKAGLTGREADALTRDDMTEKGYGEYFGHSTGHGIGIAIHEAPGLFYSSDAAEELLCGDLGGGPILTNIRVLHR